VTEQDISTLKVALADAMREYAKLAAAAQDALKRANDLNRQIDVLEKP
jgi:hypothetical protein